MRRLSLRGLGGRIDHALGYAAEMNLAAAGSIRCRRCKSAIAFYVAPTRAQAFER